MRAKGEGPDTAESDEKAFRVESVPDSSRLESRLNELALMGWDPVSVWRDGDAAGMLQLVLRRQQKPPKGE